MKNILLIATGGTIASKGSDEGLQPQISPEEILTYVPEAAELCRISTLSLLNLDSTNMNWTHWLEIAACVRDHYDAYDGFVITHGTDTMAYTAAALSYLIQKSPKPIVLTGSQKSIYLRDTDARNNLLDALRYTCSDQARGVRLVFDGKVILGTRARKTRSKSYNAFSSIDYPAVAVLQNGRLIPYLTESREAGNPVFYDALDPRVFVLKLIPGTDPGIFTYLKQLYDAVVIESFGVGGIPCYGNADFIAAIEDWIASGKTLVMTTQVAHEGSDMAVYQVGCSMKKKHELIEAYSMTLEAVVTKLMWILGQTRDSGRIRTLFYTPVEKDII